MDDEPHTFRIAWEPIEVSSNGLLNGAPDMGRVVLPGRPRYWVDDIEVSAEEFQLVAGEAGWGCVTP